MATKDEPTTDDVFAALLVAIEKTSAGIKSVAELRALRLKKTVWTLKEQSTKETIDKFLSLLP